MEKVFAKLSSLYSEQRVLLNSLNFVDFLLKNGSESIRDSIIDEIFVLKTFKTFHSSPEAENNLEEQIQSLANKICTSIEDRDLLKEQRKDAALLKDRFLMQEFGQSSTNPEDEEFRAERSIQRQVDRCAQETERDPRYMGFSSEDYMNKKPQSKPKFVESLGKTDEEVRKDLQRQDKKDKKDKKRSSGLPKKKKKISRLAKRLGIVKKNEESNKSEEEKEDTEETEDTENNNKLEILQENTQDLIDFIGSPETETPEHKEQPKTSNQEEFIDLLDIGGKANPFPGQNHQNYNATNLIDFGVVNTPMHSVSAQKTSFKAHQNFGHDNKQPKPTFGEIDLLMDSKSGNQGFHQGFQKPEKTNFNSKMFSDISSDLFDLTGMKMETSGNLNSGNSAGFLSKPVSSGQVVGNSYQSGFYAHSGNQQNSKTQGSGKKNFYQSSHQNQNNGDLKINEFDLI